MINNIKEERFSRNFISLLYFLQSLRFEPIYLSNLNQEANYCAIEHKFFNDFP